MSAASASDESALCKLHENGKNNKPALSFAIINIKARRDQVDAIAPYTVRFHAPEHTASP
jgi:hypothetical protein